jgi:hypothetical protein
MGFTKSISYFNSLASEFLPPKSINTPKLHEDGFILKLVVFWVP